MYGAYGEKRKGRSERYLLKFALNERDRSEIAERVANRLTLGNGILIFAILAVCSSIARSVRVGGKRGKRRDRHSRGKRRINRGKSEIPRRICHCEWQSSIRIIRRLVLQSTIVAVIRYASAHIGFGALTRSATAGTHHPGSRPLIRVDPVSIGMHERDFSFFVDSARGFDPRED